MNPLFSLAPFVLCAALAGCATGAQTFDCKPGLGVGCKSISQVNRLVDTGALGQDSTSGIARSAAAPVSGSPRLHHEQPEPLKVWIAPFEDAQGQFHEASVIYAVLNPGGWAWAGR